MIHCKKHFLAACFSLILPAIALAQAPVVDDSDNFAILDEQQSAARPRYDEPEFERGQVDNARNEKYQSDMAQEDDGAPLAHDDGLEQNSSPAFSNDNASLLGQVQTLQKEVQQLRGQLEVQTHELSVLKEQQLSFYKDLDSRMSTNGVKSPAAALSNNKVSTKPAITAKSTAVAAPVAVPASHANPADEQISYLAAYEFVKNKQYDDALKAMQAFVQKYPQSGFGANAQYWLGELFMVKKDYPHAIAHFDTVLQQFPSSNKSAASLLKTGYAYAAAGNNQEAIQKLQQVISKYPGTSTAQLANLKLEALNAM